jgi:carbon monoxide dehydrogenase subunit G
VSTILGIVVVLAVVIALALALIATRPDDFRIERSAQINAPPEAVFSIINDLSQWGRWSPYDKRDPNMKKTFEGPSSGPGAMYAWNGNSEVGEGRLTIVDAKPGELVTMKLEFTRPFKATNEVNFKLAPSDHGTCVSWIMDGKYNLITKTMSLCMSMDKMVGKDFEQGLANLNTVAQGTGAQS